MTLGAAIGDPHAVSSRRRIVMFQPGLSEASLGRRGHEDLAQALRALGHDFRLLTVGVKTWAEDSGFSVLSEPAWTRGLVADLGAPLLRTRTLLASSLALARSTFCTRCSRTHTAPLRRSASRGAAGREASW